MTEASTTATTAAPAPPDERPYSPGLAGVVAGETALSLVDGERGRLLYRGFRIGDIVNHGTYSAVANLLWTGEWDPRPARHGPGAARGDDGPARPAADDQADGRPADRGLGLGRRPEPDVAAHRGPGARITAASPSALAAFARLRQGLEPVEPDPSSTWSRASSTSSTASGPIRGRPRRSMPTSWSAPSTASMPRPSRPAS